MKLATYQDGSRDGHLLVVSRDLSQAHYATAHATRLQQLLDDWGFLSPQLEDLYLKLNQGRLRHAFNFEPSRCMAPLPRAYQFVTGAAYERGLPEPRLERRGSDDFLGAADPARCASEAMGVSFEAGIAVITGDVTVGVNPAQALDTVRLLMLANDWRLQNLQQAELATAFSPVAVTPDELGAAWQGGRVELNLKATFNGKQVGLCETGSGMTFHFGQLIAQLARTRGLRAGTIIGSGAVSDPAHGYCSIADQRALETRIDVNAVTPWMQFGDSIRIEMKGRDGGKLFGTIDQDLLPLLESAQ
jgi:fumarylacetoacetate (FAA) hydrolase